MYDPGKPLTTAELTVDARNRSWRTLWPALVFDAVVAVGVVVVPELTNASQWGDLEWPVIGFLVVKSVTLAAFSFVMRRFLDSSGLPTGVPPSDPRTVEGHTAVVPEPTVPPGTPG